MHLIVYFRGQAQGVPGTFTNTCRWISKISKSDRVHALVWRRQKAFNTLSISNGSKGKNETLAKKYLIDALLSFHMLLRIMQSRPQNLNETIRHTVELNAFVASEQYTRYADSGLYSGAVSESV